MIVIVGVYYDGGYVGNCVELLLRLVLFVDFRNIVFVFVLLLSLENIRVLVFIDLSLFLFLPSALLDLVGRRGCLHTSAAPADQWIVGTCVAPCRPPVLD